MTDEKWEQFVEFARNKFRNVELRTENLVVDTPDGPQELGTEDILEFDNPAGRFQVVRENKPAVVDKKLIYSHRQGDTSRAEYKFSETEFSHKLFVYTEDELGDWEEISLDKLGI